MRTDERVAVLRAIARRVPAPASRPAPMAVDGPDGSGRTWFAAALAEEIRAVGRPVHLVHVDDFHHPRAVRHRRGRGSPEGFFLDGYDYEALRRLVLVPVRTCGPVTHRDELAGEWDLSVLLGVPFAETVRRMAERDGTPADPADPRMQRSVERQRISIRACDPRARARAGIVVDDTDTDPAHPRLRDAL